MKLPVPFYPTSGPDPKGKHFQLLSAGILLLLLFASMFLYTLFLFFPIFPF